MSNINKLITVLYLLSCVSFLLFGIGLFRGNEKTQNIYKFNSHTNMSKLLEGVQIQPNHPGVTFYPQQPPKKNPPVECDKKCRGGKDENKTN